jgi:hypothetical protein
MEGYKVKMSQHKTQNTKYIARKPPPFNFNIFLKYFKYFYFNFYINFS